MLVMPLMPVCCQCRYAVNAGSARLNDKELKSVENTVITGNAVNAGKELNFSRVVTTENPLFQNSPVHNIRFSIRIYEHFQRPVSSFCPEKKVATWQPFVHHVSQSTRLKITNASPKNYENQTICSVFYPASTGIKIALNGFRAKPLKRCGRSWELAIYRKDSDPFDSSKSTHGVCRTNSEVWL